jgi:lipopolysaccharide export system protein LptA
VIARAFVIAVLLTLPPCVARAQERQRCTIEGSQQTNVKLPSGQYNSFMGGGVFARCPAKSVTLRADSLESYGDEGRIFFIGHVHYAEPRLTLTSNYLTYYQVDERIVANGDVDALLPSGSTMRGPFAEYQRVIPGRRPDPILIATGRPTFNIVQKDSADRPQEPTIVVANNVTMRGDSLVFAGGQVQVTRTDVLARGDSMFLDGQHDITVLLRDPSIEGKRDRPFTLKGDRIVLTGRDRKLERVLSTGKAVAVSQDMTLSSDTIDLRVANDLLQRAIAFGPGRAHASSTAQKMTSDSIDVTMPNQRVQEVHAVRKAVAEGTPDSTRFKADTVDWMRGDTIVARFDTTVRKDSANTARMKEIVAVGNARSFYHLAPSDSTQRRPAINYVVGKEIVVAFDQQKVSRVTVVDQAAGVYLEPRAPRDTTPGDTARARPAAGRPVPPAPTPRPPVARPDANALERIDDDRGSSLFCDQKHLVVSAASGRGQRRGCVTGARS